MDEILGISDLGIAQRKVTFAQCPRVLNLEQRGEFTATINCSSLFPWDRGGVYSHYTRTYVRRLERRRRGGEERPFSKRVGGNVTREKRRSRKIFQNKSRTCTTIWGGWPWMPCWIEPCSTHLWTHLWKCYLGRDKKIWQLNSPLPPPPTTTTTARRGGGRGRTEEEEEHRAFLDPTASR